MGKYLDLINISPLEKNKLFGFLNSFLFDKKNENLILKRSELVDALSLEIDEFIVENNNINKFIIEYTDTLLDENQKRIVIEKLVNNDMTSSLYNKIYQQAIRGDEVLLSDILVNELSDVKEALFESSIRSIQDQFKTIKANKQFLAITGSSNVQFKFEEGEKLINKYLNLIYAYKINRIKIQTLFLDFSVLRDKIKDEFLELKQIVDFIDDNLINTSIGEDVAYLDVEKFNKKIKTEYNKLQDKLHYFNKMVDGELESVANNLINNLESKFKGYGNSKSISSSRLKSDAVGLAAGFAVDLALTTYKTRQESKKTIVLLDKDIEIIKNTFTKDVSNFLDDFYRLFEIYTDVKDNYIPNAVKFYNVLKTSKENEFKNLYSLVEHYEVAPIWKERSLLLKKIKFLNIEIEENSKIVKNRNKKLTNIKTKNERLISENNSLIDSLSFKPSLLDLVLSFGMYHFVYNTFLKEKIDVQIEVCENEVKFLKAEILKRTEQFNSANNFQIQIEKDKKNFENQLTNLNKEILEKTAKVKSEINVTYYQEKVAFLEEHFNNILKIDIDEELKKPENYTKSLNIISNYKLHAPESLENFEYQGKYIKLYALIDSFKNRTIADLENKIMSIKGLDELQIDRSKLEDMEDKYVQRSLDIIDKLKDLQLGNDTLDNMLNIEVNKFVSETIKENTQKFSKIDNYESHVLKASALFIDYFKDLNQILKTKEITQFYKQLNDHNLNELANRKTQLDERLKNKYQKNISNEFNQENL